MPTQPNHENEPLQPDDPAVAPCAGRTCFLQGRWPLLLGVLIVGVLLYLQWPMLKGMYYKTSGTEAPASAIAWRENFQPALDEAARTGKPVLIDFTASWCPPCKVMKHEVWPDDRVADAINGAYIPLLMDVDVPQNGPIAQRYGIRTIPTILVVDADGRVLRQGAFMSSAEMLAFLKPGA